jgi:hypothetical protein
MFRAEIHGNYSFRRFLETFELNCDADAACFHYLGHAGGVVDGVPVAAHINYASKGYKRRFVDKQNPAAVVHGTEFWAPCILVNKGSTLPNRDKVGPGSDMHKQEQYGLMCLIQFKKFRDLSELLVARNADGELFTFTDTADQSKYMLAWLHHQNEWKEVRDAEIALYQMEKAVYGQERAVAEQMAIEEARTMAGTAGQLFDPTTFSFTFNKAAPIPVESKTADYLQEFILDNHQEYFVASAIGRPEASGQNADDDDTGYEYASYPGRGMKKRGNRTQVGF